jgi:hypothetical protein
LTLDGAFRWWEKLLEDFCMGRDSIIDPLMPPEELRRVKEDLMQARNAYQLIASGTEKTAKGLLESARQELKPVGGHFIIPIVYRSQGAGVSEALFAYFERGDDEKLWVTLLNRGEGMRLHPLLEVRDGKRLYSYSSGRMLLRDQKMFEAGLLGHAWLKQLKGFQQDESLVEEIYAVFTDVLAKPEGQKLDPELASSPQRSATSLHHLPRILFRFYAQRKGSVELARLKRLNFAVKARALSEVLSAQHSGRSLDAELLRDEIAELHASADKAHEAGIMDDADLECVHKLTEQLERGLPVVEKQELELEHVEAWHKSFQSP